MQASASIASRISRLKLDGARLDLQEKTIDPAPLATLRGVKDIDANDHHD